MTQQIRPDTVSDRHIDDRDSGRGDGASTRTPTRIERFAPMNGTHTPNLATLAMVRQRGRIPVLGTASHRGRPSGRSVSSVSPGSSISPGSSVSSVRACSGGSASQPIR